MVEIVINEDAKQEGYFKRWLLKENGGNTLLIIMVSIVWFEVGLKQIPRVLGYVVLFSSLILHFIIWTMYKMKYGK